MTSVKISQLRVTPLDLVPLALSHHNKANDGIEVIRLKVICGSLHSAMDSLKEMVFNCCFQDLETGKESQKCDIQWELSITSSISSCQTMYTIVSDLAIFKLY